MSAPSPAHDYALRQLNRWAASEPGARLGEPKAIHELSLAAQRLQHALDLISSPRDSSLAQLRREMLRSYGPVSPVDDYDALIIRSSAALARKAASHRDAWLALNRFFIEQRDGAFARALKTLTTQNMPGIYERLKDQLSIATPCVAQRLNWRRAICANRNAVVKQLSAPNLSSPAALRLALSRAGRLRVLCEIAHSLDLPGSAQGIIQCRNLERHLDSLRQAIAFEQASIQMLDRRFLRDHLVLAMEVQKLILKNRALVAKLEERLASLLPGQTETFPGSRPTGQEKSRSEDKTGT